ncbi:MAG: hypothetical protein AAFQ67_08235, partial [Pseudomonadota bacterium]
IARFRWSTQAGLNATSAAPNGEVEDYAVRVIASSSLPTCPAGLTLSAAPGFADSVFSETSVSNSERALGALETAGTTPPDAFAAELNTGSDDLVLDFGAIIPENATITFSVARDNGGSGDFAFARILLSADGSSFTDLGIYGPPFITLPYVSSAQNVIEQFTLTVPSGGAQFIRFDPLTNDDIFVDGASYDFSCAARPELRANKVATVFDPDGLGLYALPGNDVVYTITVSNAGGGATDVNSVDLIDRLPDEVEFFNGAFDTTDPTSGPVEFVDSSSGLTFDENNDVAFSDDASRPANFADCTYAPAVGYDPAVSFICFNPKGALGAGDPDPAFSVSFRARIK